MNILYSCGFLFFFNGTTIVESSAHKCGLQTGEGGGGVLSSHIYLRQQATYIRKYHKIPARDSRMLHLESECPLVLECGWRNGGFPWFEAIGRSQEVAAREELCEQNEILFMDVFKTSMFCYNMYYIALSLNKFISRLVLTCLYQVLRISFSFHIPFSTYLKFTILLVVTVRPTF